MASDKTSLIDGSIYSDDDNDSTAVTRTASENIDAPKKHQTRMQFSGNELVVAVFVTAFDMKKGNMIEWNYPAGVNLDGVEFNSMVSGAHTISKDFVYFKHNQLFGLSCFEKIAVANEAERGVRMKSVGLLAVGYSDLHTHQEFLQRQARKQLESPGDYSSLEEYFCHHQSSRHPVPRPLSGTESLPSMNISHPAGCFTQFLQYFGVNIFVLWKLALLKKRILFFSPPPIGVVCYRVYCTCLLGSHGLQLDIDTNCDPQFYINVAGISELENMNTFVACTTEKIFQTKTELYDVFVDNQNITTNSTYLEPVLKPNLADEQRFKHLNTIRSDHFVSFGEVRDSQMVDDELGLARCFQEMNSQLFRTMHDAATSEDHVLTVEMVDSVGLDPVGDKQFLTDLARVHDMNLNVQRPVDMFSCCV
ncbi:hypothetical protein EMCRGX_G031965 [Ephydatia muelleri]